MRKIEIPQPIPNEICLVCDVCCRFPSRESFLSPFFAEEEIEQAVLKSREVRFRPVQPSAGGQIVPVPSARGFRCPFFHEETHRCDIYARRPLDCRLYPYALMLDSASAGVWLGIDTKCTATHEAKIMENLVAYAGKIWDVAMSTDLIELVIQTPRLIGPHQPDVLPLFRLEEMTGALVSSKRLIPWRSPCDAFPGLLRQERRTSSPPLIGAMNPLTLADRVIVEKYLSQRRPRLAGQTFAIQFMAGDLMSLTWREIEGFLCLWALDQGTMYMPLPPLGSGDFQRILPRCFAFMDQRNPTSEISRIENLSLTDIPKDGLADYSIRPGFPEYVYRRKDIVELRGRIYHARRADGQAFAKTSGIEYRPYQLSDETAAEQLFDRWQAHRIAKTHEPVARKLLLDSRAYHFGALREGEAMGLMGRVICLDGDIVAYTFGVPLNEETFVVALEVTDPTYRGASAYIFREFSRELDGYTYINLMDDSGLPGLRSLKRSYRPWRLEPSFVLYRKRRACLAK